MVIQASRPRQAILSHLRSLEPWAWGCSFICWLLVSLLVVPLPLYASALLLTGLSLGPIVSFGRRSFRGVLTCVALSLMDLLQSLPTSQLPDVATSVLIDILFGLLWWTMGQAFARIHRYRFWVITLCWTYRWLVIMSWGTALFRVCYASIYGANAVIPHSVAVSIVIDAFALLVTIPLMFIIPPTTEYGQSNRERL